MNTKDIPSTTTTDRACHCPAHDQWCWQGFPCCDDCPGWAAIHAPYDGSAA